MNEFSPFIGICSDCRHLFVKTTEDEEDKDNELLIFVCQITGECLDKKTRSCSEHGKKITLFLTEDSQS